MYFDTLKFSLSFLIFSLASRFYAGSRPAASHSVRSTQSEEQPNSLDRCALWPGRPWTGLVGPWTAGTAASGCTLTAHRPTGPDHRRPARGLSPPTPPGRPKGRRLFEISPEARTALRPSACALRLPFPSGRQMGGGSRVGRSGHAGGGQARPKGAGGIFPRRGAALGGGRDAASEARSPPKDGRRGAGRPPPGGYLCPKGRTTLRSNV